MPVSALCGNNLQGKNTSTIGVSESFNPSDYDRFSIGTEFTICNGVKCQLSLSSADTDDYKSLAHAVTQAIYLAQEKNQLPHETSRYFSSNQASDGGDID